MALNSIKSRAAKAGALLFCFWKRHTETSVR
jgi:hypothetical protein